MKPSVHNIALVAGEASGDMYGAELVNALKTQLPQAQFVGIGGQKMRAAGVDVFADLAQFGVVGISEVFRHWRVIKSAYRRMQRCLREQRPAVLILIDYPGFNLRLAKYAKSLGIKVLYYVSPQVWAWKAGRIETIKTSVDRMAVILPFEKAIYQQAQVAVSFVGHPLTTMVHCDISAAQARQQWGIDTNKTLIGLFPGSRRHEVQRLLPRMLAAATLIQAKHPHCEFVLALADNLDETLLAPLLAQYPVAVTVVREQNYAVMRHSHALLMASGTATLEATLLGTPMVIVYRTSWLTYLIGRCVVNVKHIGLANLLTGKTIVPELIQHHASAKNMAREMLVYLDDTVAYQRAQQQLLAVKQSLTADQADCSLAECALDLIEA